jgi:hypothetical protein
VGDHEQGERVERVQCLPQREVGAGTDDEERFTFGLTALISGFAAARGQ